jgi:RimJ/RimL family protein N-acetyltransferase
MHIFILASIVCACGKGVVENWELSYKGYFYGRKVSDLLIESFMVAPQILLRDMIEADLKIFFEQERDPIANLMSAFPARDEESFMKYWKAKALNTSSVVKTIMFNECVAGSIECWAQNGRCLVGYWIGREYWKNGIATAALQEFLDHVKWRPLYAYVAQHNKASIRVLKKCCFKVLEHGTFFSEVHGHEMKETVFIFD